MGQAGAMETRSWQLKTLNDLDSKLTVVWIDCINLNRIVIKKSQCWIDGLNIDLVKSDTYIYISFK